MQTLIDIHKASGMTWKRVAEKMAEFDRQPERDPTHIGKILARGTDKYIILAGMSFAYGRDIAEIQAASDAVKAALKDAKKMLTA